MTKPHYNPAAKRIAQLNEAIILAQRFETRAIKCREVLCFDPSKISSCKESAAMKRASMDLTRFLPNLRKPS